MVSCTGCSGRRWNVSLCSPRNSLDLSVTPCAHVVHGEYAEIIYLLCCVRYIHNIMIIIIVSNRTSFGQPTGCVMQYLRSAQRQETIIGRISLSLPRSPYPPSLSLSLNRQLAVVPPLASFPVRDGEMSSRSRNDVIAHTSSGLCCITI